MDPWRDFPSFTDGALNAFIKSFPSHSDHPDAVAEFERRRKKREASSDQAEALQVGNGMLSWRRNTAIAGITTVVLAVLFLALGILTSRTQHAHRPAALSVLFPK